MAITAVGVVATRAIVLAAHPAPGAGATVAEPDAFRLGLASIGVVAAGILLLAWQGAWSAAITVVNPAKDDAKSAELLALVPGSLRCLGPDSAFHIRISDGNDDATMPAEAFNVLPANSFARGLAELINAVHPRTGYRLRVAIHEPASEDGGGMRVAASLTRGRNEVASTTVDTTQLHPSSGAGAAHDELAEAAVAVAAWIVAAVDDLLDQQPPLHYGLRNAESLAYQALAAGYEQRGKLGEALELLRSAVEVDGENLSARFSLLSLQLVSASNGTSARNDLLTELDRVGACVALDYPLTPLDLRVQGQIVANRLPVDGDSGAARQAFTALEANMDCLAPGWRDDLAASWWRPPRAQRWFARDDRKAVVAYARRFVRFAQVLDAAVLSTTDHEAADDRIGHLSFEKPVGKTGTDDLLIERDRYNIACYWSYRAQREIETGGAPNVPSVTAALDNAWKQLRPALAVRRYAALAWRDPWFEAVRTTSGYRTKLLDELVATGHAPVGGGDFVEAGMTECEAVWVRTVLECDQFEQLSVKLANAMPVHLAGDEVVRFKHLWSKLETWRLAGVAAIGPRAARLLEWVQVTSAAQLEEENPKRLHDRIDATIAARPNHDPAATPTPFTSADVPSTKRIKVWQAYAHSVIDIEETTVAARNGASSESAVRQN